MMAIMRPLIRPLTAVDITAVVEFSLRAWAPVFESFRTVLGERVYQAIYPDWSLRASVMPDACDEWRPDHWRVLTPSRRSSLISFVLWVEPRG
jgi:hypothetical protein